MKLSARDLYYIEYIDLACWVASVLCICR